MPSVSGRGDIRTGCAWRKLGDAAIRQAVSRTLTLPPSETMTTVPGDGRFFRIRGSAARAGRPFPIRCGSTMAAWLFSPYLPSASSPASA